MAENEAAENEAPQNQASGTETAVADTPAEEQEYVYQIKIEEAGQPGVRLQNVVGKDGIRKFFAGKGEGVILATDGSGNTSTAVCRYPK